MKRIAVIVVVSVLLMSGCSAQQTDMVQRITGKLSQTMKIITRHMQNTVPVDRLMLVNAWNPFPEGEAAGLVNIAQAISCRNIVLKSSDMRGNEEAVRALQDMALAMEKDGLSPLRLTSAYRSYAYQEDLFENKLQRVTATGVDIRDAEEIAAQEVARPGTSEHHTGLAFDFTGEDGTLDSFYRSEAYAWIETYGAQYGFIVRYKEDKSHLTGIIYEPWHLRYVGATAAEAITERNLCLEEYLAGV